MTTGFKNYGGERGAGGSKEGDEGTKGRKEGKDEDIFVNRNWVATRWQ